MAEGDPRSVPEIQEAVTLFETWEASVASPAAASRFAEAVQILDDYLESEPNSPHKACVILDGIHPRRAARFEGRSRGSDGSKSGAKRGLRRICLGLGKRVR